MFLSLHPKNKTLIHLSLSVGNHPRVVLHHNDMTCVVDIEKQRKCTAKDWVYIFLTGLDHNLDQVSGHVLATFPLPSLEKAYSLVYCGAQRQVTMGTKDHSETSAMVVHKNNTQPTPFTLTDSYSCSCTHYNSTKHIVDVCWKKHGYLEWYKLKQAERKNKKAASVATLFLQHLLVRFLNYLLKKVIIVWSLFLLPLTLELLIQGATNHMTSHSSLFNPLMSSPVKSVQVANGTPMPISGDRNVSLSITFSMSFVLLAPSLSNSIVSISKITKYLNCSVTFHSTHCVL